VKVTTEPIGSTSQHVFQIACLADWGVHRLALADLCEHRLALADLCGGSTKDRASAARFRGRRRCSGDQSAGRRRGIGQGASAWRCGADGALGEGGEGVELWFN
jgi:hypothetical protein